MTPEKQLAQQIRDLITKFAQENRINPRIEFEYCWITGAILKVQVTTKATA